MKIAVTGASGFVGRHVVASLACSDNEIIASSRSEIGTLPKGVRHVALDIAEPAGAFDRLGRPDVVVHLAWAGLPNYRSLHHFETELPTQFRFLRGMVDDGLGRLVVAGTCYEYGMLSGALDEMMVGVPTNPYGHAKLMLLHQLQFLKAQSPFALSWARLFYSWGEGQAPSSLWSQLNAAVARGDARFPMSGGEQIRDFLAVSMLADHLAALARRGGDVGVVNVCSGQPIAVRSLVERWLASNGWSIELTLGHFPYPDYEPLAFWGNNTKLLAEVHKG
jgi:dTDP-6-deoxy-L-talose 4-dehydrogenase (NAD+)